MPGRHFPAAQTAATIAAMTNPVTSSDGTRIAFERSGDGPAAILVGGALSTRFTESEVAALLATDFSVLTYDRRGRGDSGDATPYAVAREVEDLDALIAEMGGSACVYGTSSGANLALEAAAAGLPISRLALWEPNFLVDGSRPPLPGDYVERLEALVGAGRRGEAVEYFLTAATGMPAEYVAPMREQPFWPAMEATAHTLPYDGTLVAGFELPHERLESMAVPALVLDGGQVPWLSAGADALAAALPGAERRTLEGQQHNVAADAIAPALAAWFAG
jgi:pimeloyl-ACP methyl ester carboxylesterase